MRKFKLTRPLVAAMLAAIAFGGVVSASAATTANMDMQALVLGGTNLNHALRLSSTGAWNGFNNVSGAATVPSSVTAVASTGINGDLHSVVTSSTGPKVYHAIRMSSTGAWMGFNSLTGFATLPSATTYPSAAAANVNGDLHVLLVTNTGKLYHAIRFSSTGAWNGFNLVNISSLVFQVAAAGVNGDLQVVVNLTGGGGIFHAIRFSSTGAWTTFNNIASGAVVPAPSSINGIAVAAVGQDLHVVINETPALYHAIRVTSTGFWQGFNAINGPASFPASVNWLGIATAGVNGDLQLLASGSNAKLYHALRLSSTGAWKGLNDASCCATIPATPTTVSIAGT